MQAEIYKNMADVQQEHWWFVARRQILKAVIGTLALPHRPRILEIGCGPGGNLSMLAAFGELSAMEYDESARALAQRLGVCAVARGGLPEPVPFPDGHFDLICLLDVLEHIDDDTDALLRISRLLKPSGKLLVTVPAYNWLWSDHDVVHHHRRRYTATSLKKRALGVGLEVGRVGYFNTVLFPLIALARMAQKLADRTSGSDSTLPSPWLNRLLRRLFGWEGRVVPQTLFPFGTSVMAVLMRPPCQPLKPPASTAVT